MAVSLHMAKLEQVSSIIATIIIKTFINRKELYN